MVLAAKNGNITSGNEVNLEYRDHSNSPTSVQKWRFLITYFGMTGERWGVFENVESGLFLTSRSNTSLTIEQGNFKSQKLYPYLFFSNTTCIPIKME